jgi:hypothetical protein
MFLSYPSSARAEQAEQIEWQDQKYFTAGDRTAIPSLARAMGIQNPKRIYHGESLPSSCPFVMVESAYSDSGHLRSFLQLVIHRKDSKCARPVRAESRRVGRWFASNAGLRTWRQWKIEEGQWVKYVAFEDGVSYEDAELIMLAIKHRQLVNRLPHNVVPLQIPAIDPGEITSIRVKTDADRTFEVWSSVGGSGDVYLLKINAGRVELHGIQMWMA